MKSPSPTLPGSPIGKPASVGSLESAAVPASARFSSRPSVAFAASTPASATGAASRLSAWFASSWTAASTVLPPVPPRSPGAAGTSAEHPQEANAKNTRPLVFTMPSTWTDRHRNGREESSNPRLHREHTFELVAGSFHRIEGLRAADFRRAA